MTSLSFVNPATYLSPRVRHIICQPPFSLDTSTSLFDGPVLSWPVIASIMKGMFIYLESHHVLSVILSSNSQIYRYLRLDDPIHVIIKDVIITNIECCQLSFASRRCNLAFFKDKCLRHLHSKIQLYTYFFFNFDKYKYIL